MSRSPKKRNKVYVQRSSSPFAGISLLMGAVTAHIPVTESDAGELEMVAFTALDAVTHGHGTSREWDCLSRCLNQSWTLAHQGIGAESIPMLTCAQDGMRRAVPRYDATGKFGLDGDALRDIRLALLHWGQQLRLSTIGEVDAATRAIQREYHKHPERRA